MYSPTVVSLQWLIDNNYKRIEFDPNVVFNRHTDYIKHVNRETFESVCGVHGCYWKNCKEYDRLFRKSKIKIKKIV